MYNCRSIRLPGFDYFQDGAYFITICAQNREGSFGQIVGADHCVRPQNNIIPQPDISSRLPTDNSYQMVLDIWNQIPDHYRYIEIDKFVVMPDHIHGIIAIGDREQDDGIGKGQTQGFAPTILGLSKIVQRLKSLTAKRYIEGVKQNSWVPFEGRLWQRNYFEHLIRNESDLFHIREYIHCNPQQWASDNENSDNMEHLEKDK